MKYFLYLFKNILLTILLLIFSFSHLAAEPDAYKEGRKMRGFSVHDANGDGLLSREEYQSFFQHHKKRRHDKGRPRSLHEFDEVDKNQDGFIDEDELIIKLNRHLKQHRRYRYQGGTLNESRE